MLWNSEAAAARLVMILVTALIYLGPRRTETEG